MEKRDYVIAVNGPGDCWLAGPSDEQDRNQLVTTSDRGLVWRFADFIAARAELRRMVKAHPCRSFRLDLMPKTDAAQQVEVQ